MEAYKLEDREILKAKVKANEVTMEILETLYNEGEDRLLKIESSRTYKMQPHEDLLALLEDLKGHLAVLSGYATELPISPAEKKKFQITGYSIGGDADKRGVVLTGNRKVMKSRQVVLNTPFLRFTSDQETYKHITELDELIDELNHEVLAYMDGKFAPNPQMELELPDGISQSSDAPKEADDAGAGIPIEEASGSN